MTDKAFNQVQTLLAITLATGIAAIAAIALTGHVQAWAALSVPGSLLLFTAWRVTRLQALVAAQMKAPDQLETARLASVFEQQDSDGLMLLDSTGHILRMNSTMLDMLATLDLVMPPARSHPEHLTGHRFSDIMMDSALKTRLAWPKAFDQTRFDIGDARIDARMQALGYQPGLSLGWLLTLRDVSQQEFMQAELQALLESGLRGDFARRVDAERGPAHLVALGQQLNGLYARIYDAQHRLLVQLDSIGNGDLRIDTTLPDTPPPAPFQEMQDLTDNMAVQYTALVSDLVGLSDQIDHHLTRLQEEEDQVLAGAFAEEDSRNRRLQLISLLQTHAENLARLLELFRTGALDTGKPEERLEGLRTLALVSRP